MEEVFLDLWTSDMAALMEFISNNVNEAMEMREVATAQCVYIVLSGATFISQFIRKKVNVRMHTCLHLPNFICYQHVYSI